jgi:hypothetical protein
MEQGAIQVRKCPYCAEEVSSGAIVCKHCSRRIGPSLRAKTGRNAGLLAAGVFLGLIVVGVIGGLLSRSRITPTMPTKRTEVMAKARRSPPDDNRAMPIAAVGTDSPNVPSPLRIAGTSATPVYEPPPPAPRSVDNTSISAEQVIQSHCTQQWKDDYTMRAYCEDQQHTALAELRRGRPSDVPNEPFQRIRTLCAEKWPGDFVMRQYCENQQCNGYRRVGTVGDAAPTRPAEPPAVQAPVTGLAEPTAPAEQKRVAAESPRALIEMHASSASEDRLPDPKLTPGVVRAPSTFVAAGCPRSWTLPLSPASEEHGTTYEPRLITGCRTAPISEVEVCAPTLLLRSTLPRGLPKPRKRGTAGLARDCFRYRLGTIIRSGVVAPGEECRGYAEDQLVPLELGGSDEELNRWPIPLVLVPQKERLDRTLHWLVCEAPQSRRMSLRGAWACVSQDWIACAAAHAGDMAALEAERR